MKVIFLDIDGVCNSRGWFNKIHESGLSDHSLAPTKHFDPACVERLHKICDIAAAEIVIISSWQEDAVDPLIELGFKVHGLTGDGWPTRRAFIDEYLLKHPEITSYVILDDDRVDGPNVVRTSFYNGGLLDVHVEAATNILKNDH